MNKEFENAIHLEKIKDEPTLKYLRKNLQRMTGNPLPLPPTTSSKWIFSIYKMVLKSEIRKLMNNRSDVPQISFADSIIINSSSSESDSVEDSDSSVSAYAPKKNFHLISNRKLSGRTTKKKRKKKKAKKAYLFHIRFII